MGGYSAVDQMRTQAAQRERMKLEQEALKQELANNPQLFEAQLMGEQAKANQSMSAAELNALKFDREKLEYDLRNQFGMSQEQAKLASEQALQQQRLASAEKSRRTDEYGGNLTGTAGQLAAYNAAVKSGDPNADLILEGIKKGGSGASNDFRSYPMDVKRSLIAKGVGLGYDQAEAGKMLNEGYTLAEMAEMRGIPVDAMNSSEYAPVYNPTQPSVTAVQKRVAAEQEIAYLAPKVAEWITPYADPVKIMGYSPTQIADAVQGKNIEQQAKFFAGTAIFPELTYMRIRLAAGESGISALQHMEDALAGKVKQFEPFMSRETYQLMHKHLNEALAEASHIANQAILDPVSAAQQYNSKNKNVENDITIDDLDAAIAEAEKQAGIR